MERSVDFLVFFFFFFLRRIIELRDLTSVTSARSRKIVKDKDSSVREENVFAWFQNDSWSQKSD